jgi:hypothetical protein
MGMKHRNRRGWVVMTAAVIALLLAATAVAAAPKSGTYKGNLAPPQALIKISMKLSGKRLTHIKISNIPAYCSSGGPAVPVSFPATKLSASHRFTIHHNNKITVGPLKGKVGEKFTLSGHFNTHGKVTGTLKTVFPFSSSCNGSSSFSAKR